MEKTGSHLRVRLSRGLFIATALFALLLTSSASATITVKNEHYESLPAAFGRPLEQKVEYKVHLQFLGDSPFLCNGLQMEDDATGVRMQASLHEAVGNSTASDLVIPRDGYPIALLVSRGSCSFEEKARIAQDLSGYVNFVIVYDDQPRSHLVPMSATDPSGIHVGMLFVSQTTGTLLKRALSEQSQKKFDDGGLFISLDSVGPRHSIIGPTSYNEKQQFMLAALSGFFTLMACFGCLIVCIHTGYIHRDGNVIIFGRFPVNDTPTLLSEEDVMTFPEVKYMADGMVCCGQGEEETSQALSNDTALVVRHDSFIDSACAICIEEYQAGETLRMLPCGHKFHTECIVPWLTERHPSCPLCKHDIVVQASERSEDGESWLSSAREASLAWFHESSERGRQWIARIRDERRRDSDMRHPLLQDIRSPSQPNVGPSATDDSDNNSVSNAT